MDGIPILKPVMDEKRKTLETKLRFLEQDARRVLAVAELIDKQRNDDDGRQQQRYMKSIRIELGKIRKSISGLTPLVEEHKQSHVRFLLGAVQDLETRPIVSSNAAQSLVTRIAGLKNVF